MARSPRISIHVPLAGDDSRAGPGARRQRDFYPRPPCGGRPDGGAEILEDVDFYPRPPCGGRLLVCGPANFPTKFLSTSPLRGTTEEICDWFRVTDISIHVPLAGDDSRALR